MYITIQSNFSLVKPLLQGNQLKKGFLTYLVHWGQKSLNRNLIISTEMCHIHKFKQQSLSCCQIWLVDSLRYSTNISSVLASSPMCITPPTASAKWRTKLSIIWNALDVETRNVFLRLFRKDSVVLILNISFSRPSALHTSVGYYLGVWCMSL